MLSTFTHEIRLKKMIAVESLSAEIYAKLAKKNHSNCDLWERLRKEELAHAKSIFNLHDLVKEGRITVEHEEVSLHSIEKTLEFLELQLKLLGQKSEIASVEALSLAEVVEDKTIDSLVFDAFKSKFPELEELLKKLRDESMVHRQSIRVRGKTLPNALLRFMCFCRKLVGGS